MADGELIATWPAHRSTRHLETILGWSVVAAVSVIGIGFVGSMVVQGVHDADLGLLAAAAVLGAGLGIVLLSHIRSLTARVELRRSGLVVAAFGRARSIRWPEIARTEVDDIEFPTLHGRGPAVVVHLVDGSSVRLWATESSKWGYERRMRELEGQAEMIRRAHRTHDEHVRRSTAGSSTPE